MNQKKVNALENKLDFWDLNVKKVRIIKILIKFLIYTTIS